MTCESWENVTDHGYINKMDTIPASEPRAASHTTAQESGSHWKLDGGSLSVEILTITSSAEQRTEATGLIAGVVSGNSYGLKMQKGQSTLMIFDFPRLDLDCFPVRSPLEVISSPTLRSFETVRRERR